MSNRLHSGNSRYMSRGSAAIIVASLGLAACGNVDGSASNQSVETVQSALIIGSPGHALDYVQCATEGGTCVAQGLKYLAFGANGSFFYKTSFSFSNTACSTTAFGGDPAPGVVKACYFANYEYGVAEGSMWSGGGAPRNIAFGANGKFNFATFTNGFTCNTATFGDPIPGVSKACYAAIPDYAFEATEGGTLTGLNKTPLAFGANGKFVFTVASTSSMACTTTAFGSDPAPGVTKACYALTQPFAADEGGSISGSSALFYFGSGLNGNFLVTAVHGTVPCTTATFGGDPDYGNVKHCY
jgi:hypothetical protein